MDRTGPGARAKRALRGRASTRERERDKGKGKGKDKDKDRARRGAGMDMTKFLKQLLNDRELARLGGRYEGVISAVGEVALLIDHPE